MRFEMRYIRREGVEHTAGEAVGFAFIRYAIHSSGIGFSGASSRSFTAFAAILRRLSLIAA